MKKIRRLVKKINFYSIKTKLTICFLLLGLLPTTISTLMFFGQYSDDIQDNTVVYTNEVIDRVDLYMETYIKDIENILKLKDDYYVQQYLKINQSGDIKNNRKYTVRIWESFLSFKKMKTYLEDIRLISSDGKTISCIGTYWSDLFDQAIYQETVNLTDMDNTVIIPPYRNYRNKDLFTVCQFIDTGVSTAPAIMCIDINIEFLENICRDVRLGDSGYIYLSDSKGDIIFVPSNIKNAGNTVIGFNDNKFLLDSSGIFYENVDDTDYILTYKSLSSTGWLIVGVSSQKELMNNIEKFAETTLYANILIVAVVILLSIYLTNIFSKPIQELRSIMKRISNNDFSKRAKVWTKDEIGQLGQSLNKMSCRIKALMGQTVDDQKKIQRMEIKALQEMIKPHFIYNTLDSIIGLLEQNNNEDAMDLTVSLGKFFRMSLNHGKEMITVQEEINHIHCYLLIQQFRFSNKFDYLIEIEDNILNFKIIKLILQPLIENSIYHGIRSIEYKGLIVIKAYITEKNIVFEVTDNGEGLTEEKVNIINEILKNGTPKNEDLYFGICNVNDRIRIVYGSEYGLYYKYLPNGTRAVIVLPLIYGETNESNLEKN